MAVLEFHLLLAGLLLITLAVVVVEYGEPEHLAPEEMAEEVMEAQKVELVAHLDQQILVVEEALAVQVLQEEGAMEVLE